MSNPQFVVPETPVNVPVRRGAVPRAQASRRILMVRLGAYGDILMGTPLVSALREAYPDAHLTWVCERHQADAVSANPHLDEILLWDGRWWKRPLRRGLWPLWLLRAVPFARVLRDKKYDVFISLQPEEWPLLTRFSRAPVRIGVFDTFQQFNRNRPTSRRTRLFTHPFTSADLPTHRAAQYLLPLRVLGREEAPSRAMTLGFTQADADAARALTGDGPPYAVLAPFTTWPTRCWPAERYAALGDILTQKHGLRVVLIGSVQEADGVRRIASQMQAAPMLAAGTLGFRQMAALLARAALLVSGDTGPMHAAAAVGTPRLSLFGATPVNGRAPLTGPGLSLFHPVPCGPCDRRVCANTGEEYLRCLSLITVEEAAAAAAALLNSPPTPNNGGIERSLALPLLGAGGAAL